MNNFLRQVSDSELIKLHHSIAHVSLFTGAGGIDLGFSEAGLISRVMVEWSKDCCATLRANWHWSELQKRVGLDGKPIWNSKEEMKKSIPWYHEPEPVILQRDITTLSTKEIMTAGNLQVGEVAVVSGGPPCQGFSTVGKRMIDDPRNILFKHFVRVVREALPRFFFFENVPGLVSMAKGEIIKQICQDFANCGYNVSWNILNAADYGVPQIRKRVIMIGQRVDAMFLPEEGNIQLHLAAHPGVVDHPAFFREKHGLAKKGQRKLDEEDSLNVFLKQTVFLNAGELNV